MSGIDVAHVVKKLAQRAGLDYRGEINKDSTELNGTWTQSGNDLLLKLKKKESAKP